MALTAKKVYAILKRQISDMESHLNHPVRYKGTVASADLLPLNPAIGDMYNIESKSIYGEAGMNVAWNGVTWDTMGAPIDMSLYLTKEEADSVFQKLITDYFEKNPIQLGATEEQAKQITNNKNDIVLLKKDVEQLQYKIVQKTADDISITLEANTMFVFPEMKSLTVSGETGAFRFTSGSTATVLTLSDSVVSDLAIESNRMYEVSIINNYLAWMSWAVN